MPGGQRAERRGEHGVHGRRSQRGEHGHDQVIANGGQRLEGTEWAGDGGAQARQQWAGLVERGRGSGEQHGMRPRELQAVGLGAHHETGRVRGAGQQVVDELAAHGLLTAHHGAPGGDVTLGKRGDGIVAGAQHSMAGRPDGAGVLDGDRGQL